MRIANAVDTLPSNVTTLAANPSAQAAERRQAADAARAMATAQAGQAAGGDEDVKAAVDSANKSLMQRNAQVEFAVDSDTGRTLVKLVDVETRKVLRQIPNEEMLRIAKNIDRMRGVGVHHAA